MNSEERKELVRLALAARKMAYVPYSHFQVGAALLAKSGRVYTGCNIENAAYTPSNCAERTAFFKAVSDGDYGFEAIAIVGGDRDAKELSVCAPCGVCRQVMMEFCEYESFEIILATDTENMRIYKLKELLPEGFGPDNLGRQERALQ